MAAWARVRTVTGVLAEAVPAAAAMAAAAVAVAATAVVALEAEAMEVRLVLEQVQTDPPMASVAAVLVAASMVVEAKD